MPGGPGAQAARGHGKILADLLARLRQADIGEHAGRKSLPVGPDGRAAMVSFGRTYRVGRQGVEAADGGPVTFKQTLAVASYFLSPGNGEASGEFVPFGRLGGFSPGRAHHDARGLSRPLLARFGGDGPLLARACASLGGTRQAGDDRGRQVWTLYAFPQLPVRLTFHPADEEFPAAFHVLFERRALEFLGLECLGFLPDFVTDALLGAAA